MKFDYTIISAWGAIVAALAAVLALWVEGKRSRHSHGIDLLLKLEDAFHSEGFKRKRRIVAKFLLTNKRKPEQVKRITEVEELLNLFESIGMLLRKGLLDKELVWAWFFYWLNPYYFFFKDYIVSVQKWEPTAWEDIVWLHKQLATLELKRRPKGSEINPSKEAIKEFLERESNLY